MTEHVEVFGKGVLDDEESFLGYAHWSADRSPSPLNQALTQCLFQRVGAFFRGRMRESRHVFSCGPEFEPHSFVRATLVIQVVKSSARHWPRNSFCG